MTELFPCPFCGAPVSFMPYKRDGLKIECKPCVISYAQRTIRFDLNWLEEKMAAHWNRRATPADHISQARDAWISVEDRLPGEQGCDSEEVLCFLNGHCDLLDSECRAGGGWGIRLGFYDAEKGSFRVHGRPDHTVTHWQRLPAPPEKPAGDVSDI